MLTRDILKDFKTKIDLSSKFENDTFYIFHICVCFYAIISSVILCKVVKSQLILLKAK